jgi:hypothetical protein
MNRLALTALPPIEKVPPSLDAGISPPARAVFCRNLRANLAGWV